MPGFALVQRQDLLLERAEEMRATDPSATMLDVLLDFCRLNYESTPSEESNEAGLQLGTWQLRTHPGWLVPLPLGYSAISPLYEPGAVKRARDPNVPFRFVESAVGLGQWISPHRVSDLRSLLWYHDAKPDEDTYLCKNDYVANEENNEGANYHGQK